MREENRVNVPWLSLAVNTPTPTRGWPKKGRLRWCAWCWVPLVVMRDENRGKNIAAEKVAQAIGGNVAIDCDENGFGKGAVLQVENRVPFEGDVLCLSMKIEIYLNQ